MLIFSLVNKEIYHYIQNLRYWVFFVLFSHIQLLPEVFLRFKLAIHFF